MSLVLIYFIFVINAINLQFVQFVVKVFYNKRENRFTKCDLLLAKRARAAKITARWGMFLV